MHEENITQATPSIKIKKPIATRLRGVPAGLLCRARDIREELGISHETWKRWRDSGLMTINIGSDAEFVMTDEVHRFAASSPKLVAPRKREKRKCRSKLP